MAGGFIGYPDLHAADGRIAKSPFGGFLPPLPGVRPVVAGVICVATAAAIGLLSSLVPAWGASRTSIVEALRSTD